MAAPQVKTTVGSLQGQTDAGVHVFKGVPYAAPPLGENRWRPPQPLEPWTGVRDATDYSPNAWQLGTGMQAFFANLIAGYGHGFFRRQLIRLVMKFAPQPAESEDCLYLNVRTTDLTGALPVMVWMHGGDHQDGSGSEMFYDSNVLPNLGVVLVTINYRLGLMGYLCHPELSAESEQGVSGNYGTLDQIAALQWVKANIAAFGGDPDNVTIFGESAGGESVAHMLTSPLARGLFHRAILQSAANSVQLQYLNKAVLHHVGAEQQGKMFAAQLLGESDWQLDELRRLPADALMERVRRSEQALQGFYPVIDGYVLPYSPFECFQRGLQAKVPIMVGSNSDEGSLIWPVTGAPLISRKFVEVTPADIAGIICEEFGEDAARLFELYPGLEAGEAAAQAELLGDSMFGAKAYFYASAHAASGQASYLYYFTQTSPLAGQTAGAFHAAEIAYVFGTEVALLPKSDAGVALSKQMSRYWRNFARHGDPADNELPSWQAWQPDHDRWMELGDGDGTGAGEAAVSKREKYDILNRHLARELATLAQ